LNGSTDRGNKIVKEPYRKQEIEAYSRARIPPGLPYVFMFLTALKEPTEFIVNLWGLPRTIALNNFGDAIVGGFGRYFANSVLVSVVSILVTILFASLASYPLARMHFRLARPVFLLFLAGSMIPVHVTLIPVYVVSRSLGIYDSLLALLGPYIGFQLPISEWNEVSSPLGAVNGQDGAKSELCVRLTSTWFNHDACLGV
jgi:ABC-type spermidine/putrescine transport system permease subunit I